MERITLTQDKIKYAMEFSHMFFDEDGWVQPVDYVELKKLDFECLRIFFQLTGIYGCITHQLVDWLWDRIDDDTIEIGSGNGTLGRALDIRCTDNFFQEREDIKELYRNLDSTCIKYPPWVENLDGVEAVKKYKPKNVVGSWITRKYNPKQHQYGGNIHGVDELEMFKHTEKYFLIGSEYEHFKKHKNGLFKKYPCKVHKGVKFMSRSKRNDDTIYEFYKKSNR